MDKQLRAYVAELVGSFFLVFFIAASVCAANITLKPGEPGIGLVGIAVAQGAILAALLFATTRVSDGCLNPAVSITLWITQRFNGPRLAATIAVQVIGAAFAGGLVLAVFSEDVLTRAYVGTPHLKGFLDNDGRVTAGMLVVGVIVEAILTFVVSLVCLTTVLSTKRLPYGPICAGLSLTAAVLVGYHVTGAGVNPARWFGVAMWQGTVAPLESQPLFSDHPAFWIGPILGAMVAGVVYTSLIHPASEDKT